MEMSCHANIPESFKIFTKQTKEDKYYWIGDVVIPMGLLSNLGVGRTDGEDERGKAACHVGKAVHRAACHLGPRVV